MLILRAYIKSIDIALKIQFPTLFIPAFTTRQASPSLPHPSPLLSRAMVLSHHPSPCHLFPYAASRDTRNKPGSKFLRVYE